MNWIKPCWPAAKNVHAAVTLRTGGVSSGGYSSLNPASHVNDEPEKVLNNRNTIAKILNLPSEPLWLQQVHGSRIVNADHYKELEQADAIYSHRNSQVCVVLTADCLPILLTNSEGTKIAAIHAGWRSLLAGIISNTVYALETENIIAWLGPAICSECFEVGAEVRNKFVDKSTTYSSAFRQTNQDKYLADIYQLAKSELASLGITQVYGGDFCTVTDKQRFYSYRRNGETGRMATLIWRD